MCTMAALPAIGATISAAGALMAGRQEQALARAQGAAFDQQAEADRRAANFEIARESRSLQAIQGAAIARVGASGVTLQGSPAEVLAANAAEHQLDLEAIRYGSQLRQGQLKTQAQISRFQGAQARTDSVVRAGSEFVSGISQYYDPNKAVRLGVSNPAFQAGAGQRWLT